jgi:hypothetical protein
MKIDIFKAIPLAAVVLMVAGLLFSCQSRINQANFEKIETGMSQAAVLEILGEPTESSSVNFAGLSGAASEWTDDGATIAIQFFNGKVKFKTFSKSSRKP